MASFETLRATASRWLRVISIALLAYCAVALIFAWGLASRDGWIPLHWWEPDGNHGPWRTFYFGRTLVEQALIAPLAAFALAALGYLARPATRLAVLSGVSFLTFIVIAFTHFWLID